VEGGGEFGVLALGDVGGHDRLGAVEDAGPLVQLHRHAGLQPQPIGDDGLVAERVQRRGGDVGRWQPRPGHPRAPGRHTPRSARRPGSAARSRRACRGHPGRVGEGPRRPGLLPVVQPGLVAQLEPDRWAPPVTRPQRHRGRRAGGGRVGRVGGGNQRQERLRLGIHGNRPHVVSGACPAIVAVATPRGHPPPVGHSTPMAHRPARLSFILGMEAWSNGCRT
jgi:hypothetical protein